MKINKQSMPQVTTLTKLARLLLGGFLIATLASATHGGVILTYQEGFNGYAGTRDAFIGGLHPRGDAELVNFGAATVVNVKYVNMPDETPPGQFLQYRTVIKFVDLNLAANGVTSGAQITSVKLRLYATVYNGAGATLSAFGLLKDFNEGSGDGTQVDGVNWRYANFDDSPPGPLPQLAWNASGADATGTAYDSTADRRGSADDTADLTSYAPGATLWVEWDVTPSFLDQFSNGKEYGWVLTGPGMAAGLTDYNILFQSSDFTTDPSLRPMLVVETTLVPEPSVLALLAVGLGCCNWLPCRPRRRVGANQ